MLEPDLQVIGQVPMAWRAVNVQAHGRCGCRANSNFFGPSWKDVMSRLLKLMVATPELLTTELMEFMVAMHAPNSWEPWSLPMLGATT